jgi:hypothetical protein
MTELESGLRKGTVVLADRADRMSIIERKIETRMEELDGSVSDPLWPERKERLAEMDLSDLEKLAGELESVGTLEEFKKKVLGACCESERRRRFSEVHDSSAFSHQ